MKKVLNLATLLLLIFLGSCKKEVQQQTEANTPNSLSNARAATSTLYLRVTVESLNGSTSSEILSDGKGDYIHGSQQVEAQILSSDGNFFMQTNNTFRAPLRTLLFPFNRERLEGKTNYRLRTTCTTWLQNMELNSTQILPFRVWGNTGKGTLDWNMRFDNGQDAQTVYATVTRRDANTWTIEPANGSAIAKLTDGNGIAIGDGHPTVPFKLTLTRK